MLRKTGRRKEVIILSLGFLACVLHIVQHTLQISQQSLQQQSKQLGFKKIHEGAVGKMAWQSTVLAALTENLALVSNTRGY